MTDEHLSAVLAARVMGWAVGPDRFVTGRRSWTPRWRFQPTESLADAFRLLEEACPLNYNMCAESCGAFRVRVHLSSGSGEAAEKSKPRAITYAVARALGIAPEGIDRYV